ncbi:NAD-dependent epimerase/dehydratase family protein [Litchfieldia alkalitelluris]|uniref:NAD-dependent epimerase/dehydratase family protein n=1 Tax=Litchfieldia alkalitelluris TaxID=304268 RepID=UPI0009982D5F|nr:NAD-dependent epimerase/dehydratase family protein [Litchfieldia alkalitelluris]
MKILVTGGAGFIGSHLVDRLLKMGHEVTSVDNLSTGNMDFHKEIHGNPNFRFIQGTVFEKELIKKLVDECDVIFHLAAVLGVKNTVENPLHVIQGNIEGTQVVLEQAYIQKKKVVFSSTSEIYGKNLELPYREDSSRVLGPTTTDRWCYATAKALDEHLCFAYARKGLPVSIVRYFNIYGPRAIATQYGGVIPRFIVSALKNEPITVYGTGEQTRCFTYKDDAVDGTILCMDMKHNNQVFNIGTEHQISITQLAELIKDLTNSQSPIIYIPYEEAYGLGYEDSPMRVPDLTKARQVLGYSPSIKIEDGLKKTINWYRKNYKFT